MSLLPASADEGKEEGEEGEGLAVREDSKVNARWKKLEVGKSFERIERRLVSLSAGDRRGCICWI